MEEQLKLPFEGEGTLTGTVVRMFGDKKFGFIRTESGEEYFFHSTDVNGFFDDLLEDLGKGTKIHVRFDDAYSTRGLRAANVTVIPT